MPSVSDQTQPLPIMENPQDNILFEQYDSKTESSAAIASTTEAIRNRRTLAPASFGVAIILFFFSFMDISCNGQHLVSISGVDLVVGKKIQDIGSEDLFGGGFSNEEASSGQDVQPNGLAVLAFLSCFGGLFVYLTRRRLEAPLGLAAGITGAWLLLMLRWSLLSSLDMQMGEEMGGMMVLDIQFTLAFWLCVLTLVFAGLVSFLRISVSKEKAMVDDE